ncbi:MAG: phenylalanine--tRNA ligase subunit beta [Dehalococcoidia bacterium]|nr:phenylalanine--tRNA ligase subunit beta [Dehalococcoidia bacterium]
MKCSLKWLGKYVDINTEPHELARLITLAGTEVSRVDVIGGWDNVDVGQIIDINPHPNADRLRLATVTLGRETMTVVCGAPNLTVGDKIAFARVGAHLIDGHSGEKTVLKANKIRGVLSEGMICSEMELGLSQNHDGILVLPPDAPLGGALSDYMGDVIFDLEVTPNRPDMLSVLGIAHEVAALTGTVVREPSLDYVSEGSPVRNSVAVEIKDSDLCPRYCAGLVTGVKIAQSPRWLKEALNAAGMRSINNVVDITNFVMLEYGQPLHAFDYERLTEGKIVVCRAQEGEEFTTLDGVERKLNSSMLVIADAARTVAVAGVMGGMFSEVTEATTAVLIESASFKASSVHTTQVSLKLPSEASARFERGIRADLTILALRRAVQLMLEICGGVAAEGLIDEYPGRKEVVAVNISCVEAKRILGLDIAAEQIEKTLLAIGCHVNRLTPEDFDVVPPYWRSDLRIDADLIEEIVRIMGYEAIPYRLLSGEMPQQNPDSRLELRLKVRQTLAGLGFQELITYALTSGRVLEKGLNSSLAIEPLRVVHPMSSDEECLRTSLRGNVLSALSANVHREEGLICLFEVGRVYLPKQNDLPDEPEMLCGVLTSNGAEKIWLGRREPVDFFDTKGVVESLFKELGVRAEYEVGNDGGLRQGQQASIMLDNKAIGVFGTLHSDITQEFDLPLNTYLFEISLEELLPYARGKASYERLPRFPAVIRDLALVLDTSVHHQQVLDIIQSSSLVTSVVLFDVYAGKQIAEGKKSLAYRLSFRSHDHTLTDAEVDKVVEAIMRKLQNSLGVTLR